MSLQTRARNIIKCAGITMLVLLCYELPTAVARTAPIDLGLAHQYFGEAGAACNQDGGKLWGISLCGPMLFVDPQTRMVVANQSDSQGLLVKTDDVFVGQLPEKVPIANYAVTWAGTKWTMIVWSFMTPDKFQRVKLMMHESYHRIQNDLKLPPSGALNNHLDSRDGRVWLRLEWNALRQALISHGAARRHAIEDALTFREYRRTLFASAETSENALEMNEGLAEYTGFMLSAKDHAELIDTLTKSLDHAVDRPSFVGSFAYVSGPAYGVLLDTLEVTWRKDLTQKDDLGKRLQRPLRIKLPQSVKAKAERQASKYNSAAIQSEEFQREAARQKRIAEYRARLVDGPTLLIPLTDQKRISFNSTGLVPLQGVGTVYPIATVRDEWGTLEVSNGTLIIAESGRNTKLYVSVPTDPTARPLSGDGWTLQLASGWRLYPGQRKGDFVLERIRE